MAPVIELKNVYKRYKMGDQYVNALSDINLKIKKSKTFSVISSKDIQERVGTMLMTMNLFLGAIAAISLLVGAIGITNTMFTSVLEKTKEIGIMKSVGAQNRDIIMIFLINAGLVGFVGGAIGCALGSLGAFGLSKAMAGMTQGAFSTFVSPQLVLGALGFATGLGVIAGAIPAYRASKMKPVDALRYE